jgi:hypothetical protein
MFQVCLLAEASFAVPVSGAATVKRRLTNPAAKVTPPCIAKAGVIICEPMLVTVRLLIASSSDTLNDVALLVAADLQVQSELQCFSQRTIHRLSARPKALHCDQTSNTASTAATIPMA